MLQAAQRRATRWLKRKGVLAVGIGQRRRGGRWLQRQTCIVVKVAWKLTDRELRRQRCRPFPRAIRVTIDRRVHEVPIDVQETAGETAGHCQGRGADTAAPAAAARVVRPSALVPDKTLFLGPRDAGTWVPVRLRHLSITAPFQYADGVRTMGNLLATDALTDEAGAGAVLYDGRRRAVGTLVGAFAGESYFTPLTPPPPARPPATRERA